MLKYGPRDPIGREPTLGHYRVKIHLAIQAEVETTPIIIIIKIIPANNFKRLRSGDLAP